MEFTQSGLKISIDDSDMDPETKIQLEKVMRECAERIRKELDKAITNLLTYGTAAISPEGKSLSPQELQDVHLPGVVDLGTKA